MKIGIVTACTDPDQVLVARAYAGALTPSHQVFIYQQGGGDLQWEPYEARSGKMGAFSRPDAIDWTDFRGWINLNHLDAVLFNRPYDWATALKCMDLDLLSGACIGDITSETIPFYRLFDFLICHNLRDYNLFHNHPQAMYIPWGTDLDLFQPQPRFNPSGGVRFFHIARLGNLKDTRLLARAFRQVRGNVQLIIHAPGGLDRLGRVCSLPKDDPRVTLYGSWVPAPGLYFLGDVYVHPARRENVGATIAEALACGLPVIAADSPPMNEFIRENYNGKEVAVEHSEAHSGGDFWPDRICWEMSLTQAMQYYADRPEQVASQKVQARRYAADHLDWKANSAPIAKMIAGMRRLPRSRAVRAAAGQFARARLGEGYLAAAEVASLARRPQAALQRLLAAVWYSPARLVDNRAAWVAFHALARAARPGLKQ